MHRAFSCQRIGQILHTNIWWRGEQPSQQQDTTQEAFEPKKEEESEK